MAKIADRMERALARRSDAVVAISPTFLERLEHWGVADRTTVVPNWAPIDELPVHEADNPWSRRLGLSGHPVVLYSGTLGLKHDPSILALISAQLRVSHPDAKVVVVSEGKGREWLENWKREQLADNLVLLDFQPYEELPLVMASADILVAILEPDASQILGALEGAHVSLRQPCRGRRPPPGQLGRRDPQYAGRRGASSTPAAAARSPLRSRRC